ncbi:hypothetical protein DNTS_016280 [Danionella cerebrum]|uniref:Uncharacterized protein n=1 Tax=Danionella cerebrum TaxID=2873325 RepID=A0A553Q0W5_9TELE|nr:hypothetical protein DNTS_016280 [Danionella translucida]
MAALVDYEDSDSDPDQNSEALEQQRNHPGEPIINSTSLLLPITTLKPSSSLMPLSSKPISAISSSSYNASSSSSGFKKRPALLSSSFRPYVPKRLRVTTSDPSERVQTLEVTQSPKQIKSPADQTVLSSSLNQPANPQITDPVVDPNLLQALDASQPVQTSDPVSSGFDLVQTSPPVQTVKEEKDQVQSCSSSSLFAVPEQVRFLMGQGLGRSQLPKKERLSVLGHQGPFTALRWSPELQHCHLLLTASMDQTCKVWDGVGSGRCLQTYSPHCGAVLDADWLSDGRRLLSGSFDGSAAITDLETGHVLMRMENGFRVSCVAPRPGDPQVFLCGGHGPEVKAWDARSPKVVQLYRAAVQQTLDLLFLNDGREFVSSTDAVSRDSADRTLIAWDFQTTARLSNQIYQFSSQRPYRMNQRRRYEGHQVEGFPVQCVFSSDGSLVFSGSSSGLIHVYDTQSSRTLKTLQAHQHACVCVSPHPIFLGVCASGDWSGEMKFWK